MSHRKIILRSGLDEAELERLAIFSEELGENQQIFGKVIRFGYGSFNPFDPELTNNRELLEREVGDIILAIEIMIRAGDLNRNRILKRMVDKAESIRQYIKIEENLKYIPNNLSMVKEEFISVETTDYPDDPQWNRFQD